MPRTFPETQAEIQALDDQLAVALRYANNVAHTLNNHLTAIQGYATLVSRCVSSVDGIAYVDHIREASDHATHLTRGMLDLARAKVLLPRVVDANQVIEDLRPTLVKIMGPTTVSVTTASAPCLIRCDRAQLEQALLALATNAHEANAQTLAITITNDVDQVTITMTDDGNGMAEEILRHCFEPMVTTKTRRGAGLGLTEAWLTVRRSDGHLEMTSAPLLGTTVRLVLPRVKTDTTE
jgi:two-component system, cell cycle sensor histidine kinase and response regulator CckA